MVMKTTADTTKDIGQEEEEDDDDDDDVEEEEEEEEEVEEGKEGPGSAKKKGKKGKEEKGKGKKRASTEPALKVSEFAGIQIQVSFTGTGDRHLMQQVRPSPSLPLVLLPSLFSSPFDAP